MRDAMLSEDLLLAALPLLRPDAGSGPMHALMRAIEALPDCLDGADSQAGYASFAAEHSRQLETRLYDVHISIHICDGNISSTDINMYS